MEEALLQYDKNAAGLRAFDPGKLIQFLDALSPENDQTPMVMDWLAMRETLGLQLLSGRRQHSFIQIFCRAWRCHGNVREGLLLA